MRIEKVKVNFGRTVATGVKFEFIRLDVSMEASIDPDLEDPKECPTSQKGMQIRL